MFRRIQLSDKGTWATVLDENPCDPWRTVEEHKASRVTVLAASADPDFVDVPVSYLGPMYFDIDSADLNHAIASGKELCDRLLNLDVCQSDIEIHLSGSKGLHVFLHPGIFGLSRPHARLPEIFLQFAMDLYVSGMDLSVYSAGKGRMFRPPNSLRPDGRYKVPVSLEELRQLNGDVYLDFVKAPRENTFKGQARRAIRLMSIYKVCEMRVTAAKRQEPKQVIMDDLEVLAKEPPACINELIAGKERIGCTFNRIALSVARWSSRSGIDTDRLHSIFVRIAEATTSKQYHTGRIRLNHILAQHKYVSANRADYPFSCSYMLDTITTKPCSGCPVKAEQVQAHAHLGNLFVHAAMGKYYATDAEMGLPLTTFTLERDAIILDEETQKIVASSLRILTPQVGKVYTLPRFPEDAWNNKNTFKQAIAGYDGVAFLGSDIDLTRIRLTLAKNDLSGESQTMQIYTIPRIGVHYMRLEGPKDVKDKEHRGMFIYVEPEFSLSNTGMIGTHSLTSTPTPCPSLRYTDIPLAQVTDRADVALQALATCNRPEVMGILLGWWLAAQLKTHFYNLFHRFPHLQISGVAGTGKNGLTALLQRLSGLTGEDAKRTLGAPATTMLPFQEALATSATIPRIINEMNLKTVEQYKYKAITEVIKAAFDFQTISRGKPGGGDIEGAHVSIACWHLRAPLAILSEEPIFVPALNERAVQVFLDPAGRDEGRDSFEELEPHADDLVDLAPILVRSALNLSFAQLEELFNSVQMPDNDEWRGMPDRARYGYQVVLAGLKWGIQALKQAGLSLEAEAQLVFLEDAALEHLTIAASRMVLEASVTEVDKILSDIALMAHYGTEASELVGITVGREYMRSGGILYLDLVVIYPLLLKYKQSQSETLAIPNVAAFLRCIDGMQCVQELRSTTHILPNNLRPCLALYVSKLRKQGVPVEMFQGD